MQEKIIKNKKADIKKLESFGFKKYNNGYKYVTHLMNNDFTLTILLLENNKLTTELIENETNELYTLHLTDAEGNFVGQIRDEYNNTISKIVEKCFVYDVFKNKYTKKIINYIKEKYSDELEYLWEKFPDNAIARRKDNSKIEVINVRAEKEQITELLQQPDIYPGYHMNKKSWITIMLDGSMKIENIYNLIDKSYFLAKK